MLKMPKFLSLAATVAAFMLLMSLGSSAFSTQWSAPVEIEDVYAGQVEMIQAGDGLLWVFYIDKGREVMYMKQAEANKSGWTAPKTLDIYANQIKLAVHADGRIELFAIGTLGNVVSHITQREAGSDQWSEEKELDFYATQIELGYNTDESLVMVFIKPDREVAFIKQAEPDSDTWSRKTDLDIYANQIALGNHADGRIEVFAIGTLANVLSRFTQLTPSGDKWSAEKEIEDIYATQIETAMGADGKLVLLMIQPDRELALVRQTAPNSDAFSGNQSLDVYANLIEAGNNSDGDIEVVIVGTLGNVLSHITQTGEDGTGWTKEQDLDGYAVQMRMAAQGDRRLQMVYISPFASIVYSAAEAK